MRKVSIYSNPVAAPGVCGKCGSQHKDWYIDLGFDLDFNIKENPEAPSLWLDGVLYLCCDCLNSLIVDAHRQFAHYLKNNDVEVYLDGHERDISEISDGSDETANENYSGSIEGTSEQVAASASLAWGTGSD
jgi:hypothetical protein